MPFFYENDFLNADELEAIFDFGEIEKGSSCEGPFFLLDVSHDVHLFQFSNELELFGNGCFILF